MKAILVSQPSESDLRDFIEQIADDGDMMSVRVAVAWAKRSGLERVRPLLAKISERGGHLEVFLGISAGGATSQGLGLALELFDAAHVVHDRTGRTFHPKVYAAEGNRRALVYVGSNNLTAGGLYFNHEAGVILDLDLGLDHDREFYEAVDALFRTLINDTGTTVRLTAETVAELTGNSSYRVQDEDKRRSSVSDSAALDDVDASASSLFGASISIKRPQMPITRHDDLGGSTDSAAALGMTVVASGIPDASTIFRRWSKQMSDSDIQHPPKSGSNETGIVRLNKATHPIKPQLWFRHEFFAGSLWTAVENKALLTEGTLVPFYVTIPNMPAAWHQLNVDHATHREADQNNVTTVLHWGSLGQHLKSNPLHGHYITLDLTVSGDYLLTISSEQPSAPFIG